MIDAVLIREIPPDEPGDGIEVRLVDLDPDRVDVVRHILGESTFGLDLPRIACRLIMRADVDQDVYLNLPATFLAYGAGRTGPDPIRGPVLLFGVEDGALTDVPDEFLALFA
jgi:hypothetical protein